jgi:tetratricopeptide (TPR) repeat protein
VLEPLVKEFPDERRYAQQLAKSEILCGKSLWELSRTKDAKVFLGQAQRVLGRIMPVKADETAYHLDIAHSEFDLGEVLQNLGDRDTADQAFQKSQVLLPDLRPNGFQKVDWANLQAAVLVHRGQILKSIGRYTDGERMLRDSLASFDKLTAESKLLPDSQEELARAQQELGEILVWSRRPLEAEEAYRKALSTYEKLVQLYPHVARYQGSLGGVQKVIVELLHERGDLVGARSLAETAIHHHRVALDANPREGIFYQVLQRLNAALAKVLVDLGEVKAAAASADQIADIIPVCPYGALDATKVFASLVGLAEREKHLAPHDRHALAEKYLAREKDLCTQVVKRGGSWAYFLNEVAWHLATFPDPRVRDLGLAAGYSEEAVAKEPQAGPYWNTLGVIRYRQSNWNAALSALDKAVKFNKGHDPTDALFLAMTHWQLGHKNEAVTWYNQAARIIAKDSSPSSELQQFRNEARALLHLDQHAFGPI